MPNFVLLKIKCYTQKVMGFAYTAKAEKHMDRMTHMALEFIAQFGTVQSGA